MTNIQRSKSNFKLFSAILILTGIIAISGIASADNFLTVYSTYSGATDTLGKAEHFLEFGEKIAVLLPPYTIYFTISPLGDSSYSADISFHELGPGFHFKQKQFTFESDRWQTIDSMPCRDAWFGYHFKISKDTGSYFAATPRDSLVNNESIHLRTWMLRDSYADYKWQARKAYLENYFNQYRKELNITRVGKLNYYIYSGANQSAQIEINSGIGFDIPSGNMYAVFGGQFDAALPEYIEKYVIYETWGYSARALVVGFSRYYSDDIYRARKIIERLPENEILNMISNEYPMDLQRADIVCGAFVRFLVDTYGLAKFKTCYTNSVAGNIKLKEVYHQSDEQLIKLFIDYEKMMRLEEATAIFFADAFNGQLWFDKAFDYDRFLASQKLHKHGYLNRLGNCLFYLGQYTESETCFEQMNKLNPNDSETQYLLATAKLRNGKQKEALVSLKKIAANNSFAAKTLAEIYLDSGQPDSARLLLNNIKGVGDSWGAILKARLAIIQDNAALADSLVRSGAAFADKTISDSPGEAHGYIDTGNLRLLAGFYKEAEIDLATALFVDSRPYYRGEAFLALGKALDLQNDHQKAIDYYKKAIEQNPGEYIKYLAEKYITTAYKLR